MRSGDWPVPVQPVSWRAPEDLGHWGPHATNQALAGLRHIDLGGERGPEHVAFGPDGRLYAAVAGGKVLRMAADGSGREEFADTGGRVLGFDFGAGGQLIAADAYRGLLSISPEGRATVCRGSACLATVDSVEALLAQLESLASEDQAAA